ncbi:unnamed protein product [Mycena citricolor]|uniref:TEA domain-containing protein n=1 Tax=Mycena citricolor TaxID=2018698 RepID=A0AAD2Q2D0_9AGAR|nr:unnamed protein product [Mycena citricolor]
MNRAISASHIERVNQISASIAMSTVEALDASFVVQEALPRRRCYRLGKSSNQVIWPPHLDAALVKGVYLEHMHINAPTRRSPGLYAYNAEHWRQESQRESCDRASTAKKKKKIPRNVFVSNIILQETNELRTSKQVSSRLRQIQARAKDQRVVDLLNGHAFYEIPAPEAAIAESPSPIGTAPMQVAIVIAARSAPFPSQCPAISLETSTSQQTIGLRTMMQWRPSTYAYRGMDTSVDLVSRVRLAPESDIAVFRHGELLWAGSIVITPAGRVSDLWRYACVLFPQRRGIWEAAVCKASTGLTITQTVYREPGTWTGPYAQLVYEFQPQPSRRCQRMVSFAPGLLRQALEAGMMAPSTLQFRPYQVAGTRPQLEPAPGPGYVLTTVVRSENEAGENPPPVGYQAELGFALVQDNSQDHANIAVYEERYDLPYVQYRASY